MYKNPETEEDSGPFSDLLLGCFSQHLSREFLSFICGVRLGHGCSREVYACRIRDDCVVKIEPDHGHFANVQEAVMWWEAADQPAGKWLAPVIAISECGRIMLQKRTKPAPISAYPERVPQFFSDLKVDNFGLYQGRLVSHDYAMNRKGITGLNVRLTKATWIG